MQSICLINSIDLLRKKKSTKNMKTIKNELILTVNRSHIILKKIIRRKISHKYFRVKWKKNVQQFGNKLTSYESLDSFFC